MIKLFLLEGKLQNYAWGGTEFIPKLLNREVGNVPVAEYWLGAHENHPSTLFLDGSHKSLISFLNEEPSIKLGSKVVEKFGRLPFLFKVLDVNDMLSIQVHPTKAAAEKGFLRENELGIPITAAHRNYKDDNHKPEIMVALSEFWLLHGFLPEHELLQCLKKTSEFESLLEVFKHESYYGLYKKVMEQSDEETTRILQPLINRIQPLYKQGLLEKSSPDYWAAKACSESRTNAILDKGIFSIYFFNLVKVNKGEAVFQDAGVPHAYLEGQNMELMANSDNVLRGGLTPKHIDVPELLKHVEFKETIPKIIYGKIKKDGLEKVYPSSAPDFELSQIQLNENDTYQHKSSTVEVIFVLDGDIEIIDDDLKLNLIKGQSLLILVNANYKITTSSSAILYKATTP